MLLDSSSSDIQQKALGRLKTLCKNTEFKTDPSIGYAAGAAAGVIPRLVRLLDTRQPAGLLGDVVLVLCNTLCGQSAKVKEETVHAGAAASLLRLLPAALPTQVLQDTASTLMEFEFQLQCGCCSCGTCWHHQQLPC